MESVRSQSSRPVLPRLSFGFQRSLSPTRHHCPHSSRSSSPPPASSASAFSFNSLSTRSLSPTRSVNLRSVSPGKNLQPNNNNVNVVVPRIKPKKTCMCSPTNHPGSFRCSLHRNTNVNSSPSRRGGFMEARRSAMTNSLVRICSVEGDFMLKRALSSLIRPSSHQVRRSNSCKRPRSVRQRFKGELFRPRVSLLRHIIASSKPPQAVLALGIPLADHSLLAPSAMKMDFLYLRRNYAVDLQERMRWTLIKIY